MSSVCEAVVELAIVRGSLESERLLGELSGDSGSTDYVKYNDIQVPLFIPFKTSSVLLRVRKTRQNATIHNYCQYV